MHERGPARCSACPPHAGSSPSPSSSSGDPWARCTSSSRPLSRAPGCHRYSAAIGSGRPSRLTGTGLTVPNSVFWLGRPQLIDEVFASSCFNSRSTSPRGCSRGRDRQNRGLLALRLDLVVSGVDNNNRVMHLIGGYIILPLQALTSQMSENFRVDLLNNHIKTV